MVKVLFTKMLTSSGPAFCCWWMFLRSEIVDPSMSGADERSMLVDLSRLTPNELLIVTAKRGSFGITVIKAQQ